MLEKFEIKRLTSTNKIVGGYYDTCVDNCRCSDQWTCTPGGGGGHDPIIHHETDC
ncbi:MAG: hypothetical protein IPJ51_06340 [Saprospiraceae bacterium]|jgi:hypothetical protein|nr:hypothetical protein [Saprospiraceae bacterium]MBP6237580.1 hypothetical protein [Saprospiraceae bacterium]